ncbi:hypothetical protein ACIHFE_26980 [Streptomyces sp. NPDC052396]|uniref:hypothetical protein n=1 Tax=Streptomyces sp. NPDC052396 TaxID=3365689 RepID=UPI0037D49854
MTRYGELTPRRAVLRMMTALGVVATSSASATAVAGPRSTADTIMIIRHGEKPDETSDKAPFGITEDGTHNSHALLVRGWQRAGALVGLFAPDGGAAPRAGLLRPTAVYAAGPHHGNKGLRPSETVTPLAAKLGVRLNLSYRTDDEAELARELVARRGVTLVSWEHHRISDIVKGLGAVHPAPPADWPDDRFDLVWVFTREGSGWRFHQVPQLLLAGDRNNPA